MAHDAAHRVPPAPDVCGGVGGEAERADEGGRSREPPPVQAANDAADARRAIVKTTR